MQAIKNALVILVLVGVAYGAYVVLYRTYGPPPPGIDTEIGDLSLSRGVETSPGVPPAGEPMSGLPSGHLSPPPSLAGGNPPSAHSPAASATAPGSPSTPTIPPLTVQPSTPNPSAGSTAEPSQGASTTANPYPVTSANPFVARSPDPVTSTPQASSSQPATPPTDPADAAEIALKWQTAQQLLEAGKLVEAHELLSDLYGRPGLTAEQDAKLTELLGQLAGTIIFDSSTRYGLAPPYVVQQEDTLQRIAADHKVSPVFLAKINGLASPADPRPGDTIKVVRGPFRAIVDLRPRREEVTLVLDGRYAGRFPLMRPMGNDFALPPREDQVFAVVEKQADDLWIGLGGKLGLHRAAEGGRPGAHDSIRLAARDAQDLFDLLTLDSQVAIRR